MTRLFTVLSLTILLAWTGSLIASDHAYVTSIPYAVTKDNAFEVNINKIDGKEALGAVNYRVDPGERTISVSLVPDYNKMPRLPYANSEIYYGEMTITAEPGKSYEIAAKINPDATQEQQQEGNFWEPVIYKVR